MLHYFGIIRIFTFYINDIAASHARARGKSSQRHLRYALHLAKPLPWNLKSLWIHRARACLCKQLAVA